MNHFIFHDFFLRFNIFLGMIQSNGFTSVNDSIFIRIFAMTHDRIDIRTGISAGKNQTNLTNSTMNNIGTILLQLISINRQCSNITMFYHSLSIATTTRVIKGTVGVYTFISVFQ